MSMKQFGSNVQPKNFGKGSSEREAWTCICGSENARFYAKCPVCGVSYELSKEADKRA